MGTAGLGISVKHVGMDGSGSRIKQLLFKFSIHCRCMYVYMYMYVYVYMYIHVYAPLRLFPFFFLLT